MALEPWESFFDHLLSRCPGLEPDFAVVVLREASQDFFSRSQVWWEKLPNISVVSGTAVYTLDPQDTEKALVGVRRALIQRSSSTSSTPYQLHPVRKDVLDQAFFYDWTQAPSISLQAFPVWYVMETPDRMRLWPTPPDSGTLQVEAYLMPSRSSHGVPKEMFVRYRDAIVSKALSELFSMKDKPWASMDKAQVARREYNGLLSQARSHARSSWSSASLRAAPRRWL